jgi:alpha-L-fucosidase
VFLTLLFWVLLIRSGVAQQLPVKTVPFSQQSEEDSLNRRSVPTWFEDAKLGIMVHWGLYSVPGWATPANPTATGQAPARPARSNQAESYWDELQKPGSATSAYHRKKYGDKFDYYQFAPLFNQASLKWNAENWAQLFRQTGAKYVVLSAKGVDGFALWPSQVRNPNLPASATRDLVGDLNRAARKRGLKMGLYYSGGLDRTFRPVGDSSQLAGRIDETYGRYVAAQYRELIKRYQPDLLWNDFTYPLSGDRSGVLAAFYQRNPAGVINDRWDSPSVGDFVTVYHLLPKALPNRKWELNRAIGLSSGYNRAETEAHLLTVNQLVDLLVEVVSKNGNLLLNIGPRADGSIPAPQLLRLKGLGEWLKMNGEAIYGTRPWIRNGEESSEGVPVRYTQKGNSLYAILLSAPKKGITFSLTSLAVDDHTVMELLGSEDSVSWVQNEGKLMITLPLELPGDHAYVLKITPAPDR